VGARFLFTRSECGYWAEVSGGLDFGMMCATHTVSCPTCEELSDIDISEEPGEILRWRDAPCSRRHTSP